MKKGTAIKEDNKARQFAAVQKVVINKTSSGTSLWVPEDIAETDELSVTENGVYCAYDDNVFGYSQVVVNVSESLNDRSEKEKAISKITGTNPDTGDTESYGVDENGNLTKDVLPSGLPQAIHIVIAPTKKTYNDGESLDFTGIHVYLLDGEGHQWTSDEYPTGEIPFNELIFPVTVITASGGMYASAPFEIEGIDQPFPFIEEMVSHEYTSPSANGAVQYYGTGVRIAVHLMPTGNYAYQRLFAATEITQIYDKQIINGETQIYQHGETSEWDIIGGKKVYYKYDSGNIGFPQGYVVTNTQPDVGADMSSVYGKVAWAMMYGTITGNNDIPVQWIRPQDGETLEDTFQITVLSGGSSSGSSSSGGEHSGGDF